MIAGLLILTLTTAPTTQTAEQLRKLAERGETTAMVELGSCYENGDGVAEDAAQAEKWYQKAADLGDARGMWRLGMFYRVQATPDYQKASHWLGKSAKLGNADALFNLGYMFVHGEGVETDIDHGMKLIRSSVSGPDADPARMTYLGELYAQGTLVERDDVEARKWFERAARLGYEPAKEKLANMK